MWDGIPGQEKKPQGRPEFLVLFGKKGGISGSEQESPSRPREACRRIDSKYWGLQGLGSGQWHMQDQKCGP